MSQEAQLSGASLSVQKIDQSFLLAGGSRQSLVQDNPEQAATERPQLCKSVCDLEKNWQRWLWRGLLRAAREVKGHLRREKRA